MHRHCAPLPQHPRHAPAVLALLAAVLLVAGTWGCAAPPEDGGGAADDAAVDTTTDIAPATEDAALRGNDAATGLPPTPDEACNDNGDCASGFCVDSPAGKVCAPKCVDTCPAQWGCSAVQAGGGDVAYVCLPRFLTLCQPCREHKDCADQLQAGDAFCIDRGAGGSFCGGECDPSGNNPGATCPAGYECDPYATEAGKQTGQCRLVAGECACSVTATEQKLATTCRVKNGYGTCQGERKCGKDGLSACDAQTPAAELCDGVDNDCDGATDENIPPDPCVNANSLGACKGLTFCDAGKTACDAPTPASETCDGVDQDCDGTLDEGACDDSNGCTNDACEGASGKCLHVPVPGPCDDGDICTFDDTCAAGKCAAKPVDCDDGQPCTTDSCHPAKGCGHVPTADGKCDDGDPCTGDDGCKEGKCAGTPANDGAACDDSSDCTEKDTCTLGKCAGVPKSCDDSNPCTDGACVPGKGCVSAYNASLCDDGNPCTTGDQCGGGACEGKGSLTCNDGNACTSDSCNPKTGCVSVPAQGACDDGNACTGADSCLEGACKGTAIVCNDGNLCTSDVCSPSGGKDGKGGCAFLANNVPCDDKNQCTIGDACKDKQCTGGTKLNCDDANPCTADTCDNDAGCVHKPAQSACDDGNKCTSGDKCDKGACFGSKLASCDDGNACTADGCHPKTGCVHQAGALGCDDGDPCSIGDQCADKKCKAGIARQCVDGNPCTDDSCKAGQGCSFSPNTAACVDGNSCTQKDTCVAGACKPGAIIDCSDGNDCTFEHCDAKTGCKSGLATGACDDGDKCTTNDLCKSGKCVAGPAAKCDDGNPCTDDSCAPATGCANKPNTLPCKPDGKPCTSDVCKDAKCTHPALPEGAQCDDGNKCTTSEVCKSGACKGPIDKDVDGDGHIDKACSGGKDCDDANKAVHPKAIEVCDDVDNNCAGGVDEVCDKDNDDYCAIGLKMPAGCAPSCTPGKDCDPGKCPKTCSNGATDCNDGNSGIHPGANEKLEFDRQDAYPGFYFQMRKDNHAATVGPDGVQHAAHAIYQRSLHANYQDEAVIAGSSVDGVTWRYQLVHTGRYTPTHMAIAGAAKGGAAVVFRVTEDAKSLLRVAWITADKTAVETAHDKLDSGHHLAVVVGKDQAVHICHYESSKGDLLYTFGKPGSWKTEPVDTNGDVGQHCSVALAANGEAHIAYFDASKADLKHAVRTGAGWVTQTIASAGAPGMHTAMAIDAKDALHIAHYELVKGDALYTTNTSGQWKTEAIATQDTVGIDASIALDSKGAPHVSYHSATRQKIYYAARNGTTWQPVELKRSGYKWSQVLFDPQSGAPRVASHGTFYFAGDHSNGIGAIDPKKPSEYGVGWLTYGDNDPRVGTLTRAADGTLHIAGRNSRDKRIVRAWFSGTWRWEVGPASVHKQSMSSDFDATWHNGTTHVCGRGQQGLHHGAWKGTDWKVTDVDLAGNQVGFNCRVRADTGGGLHIAYRDGINSVMRYAKLDAGTWVVDVPDPKSGVGAAVDMVVEGSVDLVYRSSGLRHARKNGASWQVEVVDPAVTVGDWPSIARDGVGDLHVLYVNNAKKTQWRYATNKSGKWVLQTIPTTWGDEWNYSNQRMAFGVDAQGKLHALFHSGHSRMSYATDRFGKWSVINAGSTTHGDGNNYGNSLVIDAKGVVHNVRPRSHNLTFGHFAYSYTNKVDDNCDGK